MRLVDADALIENQFKNDISYKAFVNLVKRQPTVEPERTKGEWIEDGYNHYKAVCSECGEPCATYVMDAPRDRFCKWCGADMKGE